MSAVNREVNSRKRRDKVKDYVNESRGRKLYE